MQRTVQSILLEIVQTVDPRSKEAQKIVGAGNALNIDNVANTTPIAITTIEDHDLHSQDKVLIKGSAIAAIDNAAGNPAWQITKTGTKTFTLNNSAASGASATNQGTVVPAHVGTVDGQKYRASQHLQFYNHARVALLQELKNAFPVEEVRRMLEGAIVVDTLTPALVDGDMVASLPSGFVEFISLNEFTSKIPIKLRDSSLLAVVRQGNNHHYAQSATNMFVFREGNTLLSPGNTLAVAAHPFVYRGIRDWTIFTDVTGNTVLEVLNAELYPLIVGLAAAVSQGVNGVDLSALTRKLLGIKE